MSSLLAACTSGRQQHATDVGSTRVMRRFRRWMDATGYRKCRRIKLLDIPNRRHISCPELWHGAHFRSRLL
jgi:hypothetical protein